MALIYLNIYSLVCILMHFFSIFLVFLFLCFHYPPLLKLCGFDNANHYGLCVIVCVDLILVCLLAYFSIAILVTFITLVHGTVCCWSRLTSSQLELVKHNSKFNNNINYKKYWMIIFSNVEINVLSKMLALS